MPAYVTINDDSPTVPATVLAGVTSFKGRTGDVLPATADYDASMITNAATLNSVQAFTANKTFSNEVYATLGLHERGRTQRLGEFIPVIFNAADYTADVGITWPIAVGNVRTNSYCLIGNKMTYQFWFDGGGIVGASGTNRLQIKIPGGFSAAQEIMTTGVINYGGTYFHDALCAVYATGSSIFLQRPGGIAWSVGPTYSFNFTIDITVA